MVNNEKTCICSPVWQIRKYKGDNEMGQWYTECCMPLRIMSRVIRRMNIEHNAVKSDNSYFDFVRAEIEIKEDELKVRKQRLMRL